MSLVLDVYIKRLAKILEELERSKIDGLNTIAMEIKAIRDSKFYERVYEAFYMGSRKLASGIRTFKERYLIKEEYLVSPFQISGVMNLGRPPLPIPVITDLISGVVFIAMYQFLESVYYVNLGRPLESEDIKTLYDSQIDERIAYYLYKFDEKVEVPDFTDDFFIKLKKVRWANRDAKKLFNKLKKALKYVRVERIEYMDTLFTVAEKDFLLFLAGCSTINEYRDRINLEDVIIAYKTYFKFIKTDITKIKIKPDANMDSDVKKTNNGYLVCTECDGYYKL